MVERIQGEELNSKRFFYKNMKRERGAERVETQTDKQTEKQRDTDKQTDRKTEKHTEREKEEGGRAESDRQTDSTRRDRVTGGAGVHAVSDG